jgi:hypothetical protein
LSGQFNTFNDPCVFGLMPAAALMFRRGDVSPSTLPTAVLWQDADVFASPQPSLWSSTAAYRSLAEAVGVVTALSTPSGVGAIVGPNDYQPTAGPTWTESDTGELYRDWTLGVGTVDTPRSQAAYGFLGGVSPIDLSDVSVSIANDFAVVAVTSLDGLDIAASERLLVTAVGRAENTGMVYNLTHTQLHDAGAGPILVEPLSGQVAIGSLHPELFVYAVGPDGTRTSLGSEEATPDGIVVDLSSSAGTIYYEVTRRPVGGVLLDVHPNERAQGTGGAPKIGTAPWQPSGLGPGSLYQWKVYEFDGGADLWIQACAQCFSASQNVVGEADRLQLRIDGQIPLDVWGIMSGTPSYQWDGNVDGGNRLTLEFLPGGLAAGLHALEFRADETPILWWLKVHDLGTGG